MSHIEIAKEIAKLNITKPHSFEQQAEIMTYNILDEYTDSLKNSHIEHEGNTLFYLIKSELLRAFEIGKNGV